jgi:hypothetical protein
VPNAPTADSLTTSEPTERPPDAARILRPVGSWNFKNSERRPVLIEHLNVDAICSLEHVTGHLVDPPAPRREAKAADTSTRRDASDPLMAIPPTVYVEALTGHEVGRDGKVACHFHDDRTPSLHAYDTAEAGWTCFGGCGGGTIVDFGALLYGIEPRGAGYWEIRRRLEADLLPALRRAAA